MHPSITEACERLGEAQNPATGSQRLEASDQPGLQGALDGGVDIPHSEKRFVGYEADDKKMDHEVLRKYIFGGHVADYMSELQEEDPEKYQSHFASFIAEELEGDDLEDMYKEVGFSVPLPASVQELLR